MFKTQVRCREWNAGARIHVFKDIKPSGPDAQPYTYATAEEAHLACRKANCGAQTRDDFRVIDIANNREA